IDLPQVAVPVLAHQWRLLLPEGGRYRYRSGALRPAPPQPATLLMRDAGTADGSSQLHGTAVDDQQQSLPGVTVTLTGGPQSGQRVTVTDAKGGFRFLGLAPGTYKLTGELEGFSPAETSFALPKGKLVQVQLRLGVASVREEIMVTAETPMLDARAGGRTTFRNDSDKPARQRSGAKDDQAAAAAWNRDAFQQESQNLKQGLVGGVRPLPVQIPEAGKVLLLSGVLPPVQIGVEIEVKAPR
ncbi:MAG TPA: carboxypeptidase-like regulatory domain-containing protein, partial [Thermoanaerobaculia bacterium]